jgi:hypothetical protein
MLISSTKTTARIHPDPQTVNKKIIKYYFVACYTHNIQEWSNVFALLHVTMWIWIEMEMQLISIIDN